VREESHSGITGKVSNRAAQKDDERRRGQSRQRESLGNIRDNRHDAHGGIVVRELQRRRFQEISADIDRHVTLSAPLAPHGIENDARLGRASSAKLHERTWPDRAHDFGNSFFEQCALGTREVVLGKLGDFLEQL
jgi:hypothetical protein